MKVWNLAMGVLLLAFGSAATAVTCTSTSNWGSLGPPGLEVFGNSFSVSGTHNDCYSFSLAGGATAFGGVIEIDPPLNRLNIDVQSVSLFLGDVTGALLGTDFSPYLFSFLGLNTGSYAFVVSSNVTASFGFYHSPVGYLGAIKSVSAPTAVPEPGMLALLGVGLLGIAAARRRKQ